jgi:hypothetical protein
VASAAAVALLAVAPPTSGVAAAGGPPALYAVRDGRSVAVAGVDGTRRTVLRLARSSRGDVALALSGDGTRLAARHGDDAVRVVDLASGRVRTIRRTGRAVVLRFSPDGTRLAVVGARPGRFRDQLRTCAVGSRRCRIVGGRRVLGAPAWAPDGRRLAWMVAVGEDAAPDLVVGDGRRSRTIARAPLRGSRVWLPESPTWDGSGVAWASTRVRLRDGELAGILASRIQRWDGQAVRTVVARPADEGIPLAAIAPVGGGPGLVALAARDGRTSSELRLVTVDPGGTVEETGVVLGRFGYDAGDGVRGLHPLVDGRIAVVVGGADDVPGHGRRPRLQLVTIGGVGGSSGGPVVAEGDELTVATPWPGGAPL